MPPALLFDLDGTLLETDPLHAAVFAEIFAEHGQTVDDAFYMDHVHGRLNADIFAEHFPGEDGAALSDEKERRFRERLGTSATATPGLDALLRRAEDEGWAMAVVTNAPRENAEAMLKAIGLADHFATIVIGDDLPRGKPDPLPYATAIARLGADPARCLAFEDSRAGLTSAAGAGAFAIGLTTGLPAEALRAAGARLTIADFTDPALGPALDRLSRRHA